MAWADPIAATGNDWQDLSVVNDLIEALNERREAVGFSAHAAAVAGDDAQDHTFWADLQSAVIGTCIRFTNPDTMDVTPGSIPANFTDAIDWGGTTFTKATLFTAAGITTDWTRKRPREIADTADAGTNGWRAFHTGDAMRLYDRVGGAWVLSSDQQTSPDTIEPTPGPCQAGDYIGPWIMNEMQDALQVVDVTIYGWQGLSALVFANTVTEDDDEQGGDSDGWHATTALAEAAADADWDTGTPFWSLTGLGKLSVIDVRGNGDRRASAHAIRRTYSPTLQSGTYSYTQDAELVATVEAVGFFGSTFEDFDLTLVEDDVNLIDSGSFDDGDEMVLGGSTAQPDWESDADGVEGWGWTVSGNKISIVNKYTWEHP